MANENSQAAETQASEQAQVQGTTGSQASTQEGQQKEQPVTLAQVKQVVSEIVNPLIQSRVAKSENRINQRIQEQFAALEKSKSVLKLSDEQVAQARQQIVVDAYAQPEEAEQEPPASGNQQPAADDVPPEIVPALELMQERGVKIAEEDPEYKQFIEPLLSGPKVNGHKLYAAMEKAIDAKAARTNLQKEKANLRTSAGTGGAADLDDISSITDSKELYKLGEERMARSKK